MSYSSGWLETWSHCSLTHLVYTWIYRLGFFTLAERGWFKHLTGTAVSGSFKNDQHGYIIHLLKFGLLLLCLSCAVQNDVQYDLKLYALCLQNTCWKFVLGCLPVHTNSDLLNGAALLLMLYLLYVYYFPCHTQYIYAGDQCYSA